MIHAETEITHDATADDRGALHLEHDEEAGGDGAAATDEGADALRVLTLPTDARDYLIPAQDGKGHSMRLYCRAQPGVGRLIQDLLAARKYPFRTYGDIIRWSITWGVKQLLAGAGIPSVTSQVDAAHAALAEEEYQLQFTEFFVLLKRIVDRYLSLGAVGEARRCVTEARARLHAMPEGYWRDRYQQQMSESYAMLMTPGADEAPGAWEGE